MMTYLKVFLIEQESANPQINVLIFEILLQSKYLKYYYNLRTGN